MQAIHTKILPATNTKGTRIKATCQAGSITIGYHSVDEGGIFSEDDRHRAVARMLQKKLGWTSDVGRYGEIVTGCLPDGTYCHVLTEAVTHIRNIREAVRRGENNGNPWGKDSFRNAFYWLAAHDGKDESEA